jgi:hypothetical protein
MSNTQQVSVAHINWIVDRMHVGTSRIGVVRDLVGRFREAEGRGIRLTRHLRKQAYRAALRRHAANRALVRDFNL